MKNNTLIYANIYSTKRGLVVEFRFKHTNKIVSKLILAGITKSKVITILRSKGFTVRS